MSKKTSVPASPYNYTDVPMYFADQPAALMLGAAVSRITFGVTENDDEDFPRPVVTIAIPTIALMQLVHDLKKSFDSPSFRKHSVESLKHAVEIMASGGKATPENQTITVDNPRQGRRAIATQKK